MDAFEQALEKQTSKNYNIFQKFVLYSAGVKHNILKDIGEEDDKFFVIGTAVIMTSIAAFLSGSYAFIKIFGPDGIALFLGIFWMVIIYNTDRSIIVGLGNSEKKGQSFLAQAQHLSLLTASVVIRLGIAIFIAYVVDVPLELRIFNKALIAKRSALATDELANSKAKIDSINGVGTLKENIDQNQKRISQVNQSIKDLNNDNYLKNLQRQSDEARINHSNAQNSYGKQIILLRKQMNALEGQLDLVVLPENKDIIILDVQNKKKAISYYAGLIERARAEAEQKSKTYTSAYNKKYNVLETSSISLNALVDKASKLKLDAEKATADTMKVKSGKITEKFDDNLVASIVALDALKNSGSEGRIYINISYGIRGIIILIELLPIILKLFSAKGAYEDRISTLMHLRVVDEKRKRKFKDDEYNKIVGQHDALLQKRIETEMNKEVLVANSRDDLIADTIGKVSNLQKELIDTYIKNWYAEEQRKASQGNA